MEPEKRNIETIPSIYIFKGYPVSKKEDKYEPLKNEDGDYVTLDVIVNKLSEQYDKLFITDLSGIKRDRPQLDLLKSISTEMEIWIDPGTRYGTGVIDVLVSGADYVVIGTKTLKDLSELEKACELSENIIIDINYDDGIVSPDREIIDTPIPILAEKVKEIGIKTLIFTDLRQITYGSSFEINPGRSSIVSGMNVYFHGIFDKESRAFEKMNVKGLIMENIDLV